MPSEGKFDIPIVFLGLADHVKMGKLPFPIGPIDIFQVSQYKSHLIYPTSANYTWVFLFNREWLDSLGADQPVIEVLSKDGKQLLTVEFTPVEGTTAQDLLDGKGEHTIIISTKEVKWVLFYAQCKSIIPLPGRYTIRVRSQHHDATIGAVEFQYRKTDPFTVEELKAIEADPNSIKVVKAILSCNHCPSKLSAYSALERNPDDEKEGSIWQHDLPDSFGCQCGRTTHTLEYIKENLHSLLGRDFQEGQVEYVRRYAHSELVKIIKEFNEVLKKQSTESPFQEFIEKHPVMLAQFHAKKLFIKPSILGKFQPDFAILDTSDKLVLIELERPSLKLFKKDGHPTAYFMHAYGQVRDWLNEYSKYPSAVLEGLKLKSNEVMAVKGAVIAGRIKAEKPDHLKRHLSAPLYIDIDFLTLDDLANSLLQISRDLA